MFAFFAGLVVGAAAGVAGLLYLQKRGTLGDGV